MFVFPHFLVCLPQRNCPTKNGFLVVKKKLIVPTPLTTVIIKSMFSDFVYEITKIQDPPRSLNHRSRHVMMPGLRRTAGRLDALPGGGLEDRASPRLSGAPPMENGQGVPIEIELKNIGWWSVDGFSYRFQWRTLNNVGSWLVCGPPPPLTISGLSLK